MQKLLSLQGMTGRTMRKVFLGETLARGVYQSDRRPQNHLQAIFGGIVGAASGHSTAQRRGLFQDKGSRVTLASHNERGKPCTAWEKQPHSTRHSHGAATMVVQVLSCELVNPK